MDPMQVEFELVAKGNSGMPTRQKAERVHQVSNQVWQCKVFDPHEMTTSLQRKQWRFPKPDFQLAGRSLAGANEVFVPHGGLREMDACPVSQPAHENRIKDR